jgi:DNA-binding beta-propeller fold protein YncE
VLSGARVVATIPAADLAAPGTATITVRNPGVATISNATTFTARTVGAASKTEIVVNVPANDVAWDAHANLLYASVPGTAATYPNSIVAIDPLTGAVTGSVFVGSEPGVLAISEAGDFLYVSLRGSSTVRRVAIPSLTPQLEFTLGSGLAVEEMQVVPGASRSLAIAKMNPGTSPRHVGVFLYEDGVQRGSATQGHTGSNSIAFDGRSGTRLFGYNNESTEYGFRSIALDATGLRETRVAGGLMGSFYLHIIGAGGRIYGTDGAVIDPESFTRKGSFTVNSLGQVVGIAADPALGRVFIHTGGLITAFDMNTFASLGAIGATAPSEHPAVAHQSLVRWGTDGLAYRAAGQIFIVRTSLAAQ